VKRLIALTLAALALASPAAATPYLQDGIQDDAWLRYGGGSLDDRLVTLDALGVDLVRYTLNWRELQPTRGSFDWSSSDAVLRGLHAHRIAPVVTLWGTPGWANGGRGENVAPARAADFARFARAAATRYPFVKRWLVWNEPNKAPFLKPASARTYVQRLLNPAYAAIHSASRGSLVGGGVTGPIAGAGGISPIAFIRSMQRYGATLDAYAHNPYPADPRRETPFAGGCRPCATITMATIDKLIALAGPKRVWLTEYAYQTDDRLLGVSRSLQALYLGEGALRAYLEPKVDMLIHYTLYDDSEPGGWQSGLFTATGTAKPSYAAFRFPTAARGRAVWGQIRPRAGKQPFRLQRLRGGHWTWSGAVRWTSPRGYLQVRVTPGTYRVWSTRDAAAGIRVAIG
jgi:hypothetical protein